MTTANLTVSNLQDVGAGAFFRPLHAEELGVPYHRLQKLVKEGEVEQVARGLYRLADAEITEHYTLGAVCARVPDAIVCLFSALQYHEIGTQLPPNVWIAIPHKAREPRLPEFSVRVVRFSGSSARYGIEDVTIEGVPTRITNPARTVVDCFRLHRLVPHEAALEALQDTVQSRKATVSAIHRAAEVCGAKTLIAPYLESLFH